MRRFLFFVTLFFEVSTLVKAQVFGNHEFSLTAGLMNIHMEEKAINDNLDFLNYVNQYENRPELLKRNRREWRIHKSII